MDKKKLSATIIASVVIILCAALTIGITYSIWSDSAKTSTTLQAGTLDLTLYRTGYEKTVLDGTGLMTSVSNSVKKDVGVLSDAFDASGDKVVPGCEYSADFLLENSGEIAFDYTISITWNKRNKSFADQLWVEFELGDEIRKGYLSDFDGSDGKAIISAQSMKTKGEQAFSVKVVFKDSDYNDSAQGASSGFNLSVEAVQATK